MTELERLQSQLEILGSELDNLREQFRITEAMHMFERFHVFDAIKNDQCPCCGARVRVKDNGHSSGVKLEAVQ